MLDRGKQDIFHWCKHKVSVIHNVTYMNEKLYSIFFFKIINEMYK